MLSPVYYVLTVLIFLATVICISYIWAHRRMDALGAAGAAVLMFGLALNIAALSNVGESWGLLPDSVYMTPIIIGAILVFIDGVNKLMSIADRKSQDDIKTVEGGEEEISKE